MTQKRPEPFRRTLASEDSDTIARRVKEIARAEGRQPFTLTPPKEAEPSAAEYGGLCFGRHAGFDAFFGLYAGFDAFPITPEDMFASLLKVENQAHG